MYGPWAKASEESDYDFRILKSVMEVNADQKTKLIPAHYQTFRQPEMKDYRTSGVVFQAAYG